MIFLLFLAVLLFALARLFSSIWLQIWLDHGDGLEKARQENITRYNQTFSHAELKGLYFFHSLVRRVSFLRLSLTLFSPGYVTDNPDLWVYQLIHFASLGVMLTFGIIKGISMAIQFLKGSSRMHDSMLRRVMKCPMVFFDTTPTGRIINRFSKDMDESKRLINFEIPVLVLSLN